MGTQGVACGIYHLSLRAAVVAAASRPCAHSESRSRRQIAEWASWLYTTGRCAAVAHGALRTRDWVCCLGPCAIIRLRNTRHNTGFASAPPPASATLTLTTGAKSQNLRRASRGAEAAARVRGSVAAPSRRPPRAAVGHAVGIAPAPAPGTLFAHSTRSARPIDSGAACLRRSKTSTPPLRSSSSATVSAIASLAACDLSCAGNGTPRV